MDASDAPEPAALTEGEVEAMLDRLEAMGLVEGGEADVRTTRRWVGRLQGAAEAINREVAETGRYPAGNPLVLATARALEGLGFEGRDADVAAHVLLLLELARMTPEQRAKVGFRDADLP